MEFKKLEFTDLELIRKYYTKYTNKTCDRTIGGSFMWRDYFETMYALIEDTLIMKCKKDGETVFCFPMGENVDAALNAIDAYCKQKGIVPEFVSLVQSEMEYLKKRYEDATVIENRDWSDYLYLTSDHANFSGRKFTTQRNHINKFLKNYENWDFKIIDKTTLPDVKEFYKDYESRFAKKEVTAIEEQEKTNEVLDRYFDYGFVGYALYIEHKVVGFAIGEMIKDVMFIHVEKADKSLEGANTMLVMQFAKVFEGKATYLNREEDVGDMGLRYSKTKYRPIDMVYKYELNFRKIEILQNPSECRGLYQDAFCDDEDFENHYFNKMVLKNQILALKVKDKVASMLHIVPKRFASLQEVDYYYAIATDKKHQHKGYMSKLIDKALKISYNNGKGIAYLVPAIQGIYEPFGFGKFGERFDSFEIASFEKKYEVEQQSEITDDLKERLRKIFMEKIAVNFDDYVVREKEYYCLLLGALKSENGWVKILKKDGKDIGYILESRSGIWEAACNDLPTKNYALARIVNIEKVPFDERKVKEGYYQISDAHIEENQGLFYFKNGYFVRATNENIANLGLTEADRSDTHMLDISELILLIKYEKVYVSDEI